jgi:hypothetical protein
MTDSRGIQEKVTTPAIHTVVLMILLATKHQKRWMLFFATVVGVGKKRILVGAERSYQRKE